MAMAGLACPSEERLEALLTNRCAAEERTAVESHVAGCPRCAAWLNEARRDDDLLDQVRHAVDSLDPARNAGVTVLVDGSSAANRLGPSAALDGNRDPVIPGFQIRGRLGEGGMGVVYEAEQLTPRRAVALKIIRFTREDDPRHVRMFEREADALARLRHAGIAAIYQADRTDDGRRFFAMELVRGVPLLQYAREARLTTRGRLELFRQVADAVHYAHQRAVIHRDLKPSNLLVEPDGRVKVLDFGLARIVDTDSSDATLLTEIGKVQGTLAYMSPEQARGDADEIDVRTDVYSLGVVLFQLLTDELPYPLSRSALHEALRTICEQPPRRPSAIKPALRGDLDWIALKALEKEPPRRYASAAALSEDIGRYLARQAINARPPSGPYQLRKLVARHRVVTALVLLLFATIAGFGAWMTLLYQESDRLRHDAELAHVHARVQAETSTAVQNFLQRMLASIDPEKAHGQDTTLLREVLDDAAMRVDFELHDKPEATAVIHSTLGKAYYRLSEYERAEQHLRIALAIREQELPEQLPQLTIVLSDLSDAVAQRGKLDEAETLARRVVESFEKQGRTQTTDYSSALAHLATVLFERNQRPEAEELARRTLDLQRRLMGPNDPRLAQGLNTLAMHLASRGAIAEAQPLYEEALELQRRTLGTDHVLTLRTLNNLGMLLAQKDELDAAEQMLTQVLDRRRELLGDEHADTALSVNNLGKVKWQKGQHAQAEALFREALEGFRRSFGPRHARVSLALDNLARAVQAQGRTDEAEGYFKQARNIREQQQP